MIIIINYKQIAIRPRPLRRSAHFLPSAGSVIRFEQARTGCYKKSVASCWRDNTHQPIMSS